MTLRIDAFSHFLPGAYRAQVMAEEDFGLAALWARVEALHNIDLRLQVMDETGVDRQVLTLVVPPIESLKSGDRTQLAALANDGMAEIVRDHPTSFYGVGTVSLSDPASAADEVRRCVQELGLVGVMVYTNVDGWPLDADHFDDFFGAVEELGVPVWLHPYRPPTWADYPVETASKYLIWQALGWPIDTTIAMARLVFGGVLVRHPRLQFVIHHAGALIPSLAHRITTLYRPEVMRGTTLAEGVEPPYVDLFRSFHVDTVVTTSGADGLRRAVDFFGVENVLFGTDAPFGLDDGREFTDYARVAVAGLGLPDEQADLINGGNLLRLLSRSS